MLLGVYLQGFNIVYALVTCVYPMWKSLLTIEDENTKETDNWFYYWVIYGILQIVEVMFGFIFAYVPYYSLLRLVFLVYLMAPMTKGARTIYKSIVNEKNFLAYLVPMKKFFDAQTDGVAKEVDPKANEKKSD